MPQPPAAFTELKLRLEKIHDLDRVQAVLEWDQWVMMPAGGAAARVEQVASIERARHERLASPEIGDLLEQVRPYEDSLPPDADDASLIRVARQDYEKAIRVPAGLQGQITRASSLAEHTWETARRRSDFSLLLPRLQEVVELKRRYIECFDVAEPYDALLQDYEPGMTRAEMERPLEQLKQRLVPLAATIAERNHGVDDSCLRGRFSLESQRSLNHAILNTFPMDSSWWRLDSTAHPFATAFASTDIRITTRYSGSDISVGLFSTLHEIGHGLYENGVDHALERTPLARPASFGLHESQSRMWENMVGRSRPFWRHFFTPVRAAFPTQFVGIDPETFYRAVNKVQPSFIRTEADEVTYDLHVILRFELEQAIFSGDLELADLPGAWNERFKALFGLDVPDDARGVLQDVHWAEGSFGYFPTYSYGNLIAGQLWQAAREAIPALDPQLAQGNLTPLRAWLRENVHRHGRKLTASQVVERATGRPVEVKPYVDYLTAKFGDIYGLD
jgi:carboxypeptidase Taq